MCGIYGGINISSISNNHINEISKLINHRGPDCFNFHVDKDNDIFLAHSRLSIIDLSSKGQQPMIDNDTSNFIVFNGEIYNYLELREKLINQGISFVSNSDTEVILKGYSLWGKSIVEKLEGMFAFAIWDSNIKSFFLARDRLGEKPLYYTFTNDGKFIFSSEIFPILTNSSINRQINNTSLYHYFRTGYSPKELSIINNIYKILPGHSLLVTSNLKFSIYKYWDITPYFFNKSKFTFKQKSTILKDLIKSSVRSCSHSDVSFGIFLSGGVDSTLIASSIENPNGISTFCAGFKSSSFDERKISKLNSAKIGIHHLSTEVSINHFDDFLYPLKFLDEPFSDTSLYPMYYLSKFCKNYGKVFLSGDGGDELFGGYSTYLADKIYSFTKFIPYFFIKFLLNFTKYFPSSFSYLSFDFKLKAFLSSCSNNFETAHSNWRIIFNDDEMRLLVKDSNFDINFLREQFTLTNQSIWNESIGLNKLDRAMHFDIKTWLTDDILYKVDRMCMANSIESRAPFLNRYIVEFAASLPVFDKINFFIGKYILKFILLKYYNFNFFFSKKKGFGAPTSAWILDYHSEIFQYIISTNFFNEYFVIKLIEDHITKRSNNGFKIINLLSFSVWYKSILSVKSF